MARRTTEIPVGFIDIASTTVSLGTLREFGTYRVQVALSRFRNSIRGVTLRLVDENGPRRGIDMRCVVVVELDHGAPVCAEATTAWPTASITLAVRRAGEVLRRRREREQDLVRNASRNSAVTTAT